MPWDFIANIGQQQNIGQGKSYWLSGPYICLILDTLPVFENVRTKKTKLSYRMGQKINTDNCGIFHVFTMFSTRFIVLSLLFLFFCFTMLWLLLRIKMSRYIWCFAVFMADHLFTVIVSCKSAGLTTI